MTSHSSSVAAQVWASLQDERAAFHSRAQPLSLFVEGLLRGASGLGAALGGLLPAQLGGLIMGPQDLAEVLAAVLAAHPEIETAAAHDLLAVGQRDPAAEGMLRPFLFFKGFHALQLHRVAHVLWGASEKDLALYLQYRSSVVFGVDIHPAAQIGHGIMFDHATGLVIGETAVIEDDVSILHGVTLGGTGKERGDRHPKIRRGVMIGANATILGNIEVGEGAVVAAGSMVLQSVAPHVTVAGVPARMVGHPRSKEPACDMDQTLPDPDTLGSE